MLKTYFKQLTHNFEKFNCIRMKDGAAIIRVSGVFDCAKCLLDCSLPDQFFDFDSRVVFSRLILEILERVRFSLRN